MVLQGNRLSRQVLETGGSVNPAGGCQYLVVRDFILYLQNRTRWTDHPNMPSPRGNLAAISIQNYVRGLRAFFNWLYKEGYTEDHILGDLRPPRAPQKLVGILTEDEIRRILSCLDTDTASGCRDTAIIITALDTGLRLSEIANLKMADAQIQEGYLKVMGKGAKERIVPIGGLAQKALQRYVFHFRPEALRSDEDNLFLGLDGKAVSGDAVRLIFARLAHKSSVKHFHPHLCRHTFATNYLINGGDVFSLQQILGHTSLEMVKRYVTLASAQVRVQHRKFSPMDRMNLGRVRLGRVTRNGQSNGNGLTTKHNAVKSGS
jgi:site-specific recombinase XerD